MEQQNQWIPDDSQRQVIDTMGGCHLVLAPPGCGKTQILAERIKHAHRCGVRYEDMLCLTFTNRAARGMRERIESNVGTDGTEDIFVGNVHRYCSRFLMTQNLIEGESTIIDEDTMRSILAVFMEDDEQRVATDYKLRAKYNEVIFFSHLMYEVEHGIPKPLRLHPECVTSTDIVVMQLLCKLRDVAFDAKAMVDIYRHTDFYTDLVHSDDFDKSMVADALILLKKMAYAHAYDDYKRQHHLVDFEDLLEWTYVALRDSDEYPRYGWIQVDEVQDLNLMQLAIIDGLSTLKVDEDGVTGNGTLMYLGDEQQAIFSFMGAKQITLDLLKKRCAGHIHHLGVNHRSPKYLLDIFNTFAVRCLDMDASLLPQPTKEVAHEPTDVMLLTATDLNSEYDMVARKVETLMTTYPNDTVAVIVNSNKDADEMSKMLLALGVDHFKVSGSDVFSSEAMKLMLAHLSVLYNDRNFLAWARLFKGLSVCKTPSSARLFAHELSMRGMTPTDFLTEGKPTYLQQFADCYDVEDIVVFDTETTGLDVFEDDVIQIAAERVRQGRTIATFSVHIQTDKRIPEMLGDEVNPILAAREQNELLTPREAFHRFMEFASGAVLLAHNATFDDQMMAHNIARYVPETDWKALFPICFDSLKLIKLLKPGLKGYKLKMLLNVFHLEGENSHLADDDVHATVSLINYCRQETDDKLRSQAEYLSRKTVQNWINDFRRKYMEFYWAASTDMYVRQEEADSPALVMEMTRFYQALTDRQVVCPLDKIEQVMRFLTEDVIGQDKALSLYEQLEKYVIEINTFKEADLCGGVSMTDRVFVTTIHKAKGLEFDNVIVFDVVDGKLPNFQSQHSPKMLKEDARKLYVAMTRAKRRLYVAFCLGQLTMYGFRPRQLSPFMSHVTSFFSSES